MAGTDVAVTPEVHHRGGERKTGKGATVQNDQAMTAVAKRMRSELEVRAAAARLVAAEEGSRSRSRVDARTRLRFAVRRLLRPGRPSCRYSGGL